MNGIASLFAVGAVADRSQRHFKMPKDIIAKIIIGAGILLILFGILLLLANKIPWLGKLPGDIYIQKKNFTFYFPLTTCVIISLILSLILYFLYKKQ